MIELQNFSKSYFSKGDSFAVKDFSMVCKKGEITGLLGLNGAGKTTILKAICARHFATSGEVLIDGFDACENLEKARNLTGFVEESPILPAEYTVSEYLKMSADLHNAHFDLGDSKKNCHFERSDSGVEKSTKSQAIEDFCQDIINELGRKKIRSLSKGQRQRVNFAQALIYNPPILVLDEPASGFDPAQILKMRSLVKSLKADHTILLSTHLMQEVEALCDKIYILHEGKIVACGTIDEIARQTENKNLEEAFFMLTGGKEP